MSMRLQRGIVSYFDFFFPLCAAPYPDFVPAYGTPAAIFEAVASFS
jgi:hypothetical protein